MEELGYQRGDDEAVPEILNKLFLDQPNLLKGPVIDDVPLSETVPIRGYRPDGSNYLQWLVEAARQSHDVLRRQDGFIDERPPTALLYLMLRHAIDVGYVDDRHPVPSRGRPARRHPGASSAARAEVRPHPGRPTRHRQPMAVPLRQPAGDHRRPATPHRRVHPHRAGHAQPLPQHPGGGDRATPAGADRPTRARPRRTRRPVHQPARRLVARSGERPARGDGRARAHTGGDDAGGDGTGANGGGAAATSAPTPGSRTCVPTTACWSRSSSRPSCSRSSTSPVRLRWGSTTATSATSTPRRSIMP